MKLTQDIKNIPQHIAIIMDGNGRWAKQRGLPRTAGHMRGARRVKRIVKFCAKNSIKYLTLYAFSVDNWKRPEKEVNFLMRLLRNFLQKEREELHKNNVRFNTIGRIKELPSEVQKEIKKTEALMKNNTGLVFTLALNYGGKTELVDAFVKIAEKIKKGKLKVSDISESLITQHTYFSTDIPEPDLLIRTAGEMRVSNFLLWHISYTELWVTSTLWPDFDEHTLIEAIKDFSRRERKFGAIKE